MLSRRIAPVLYGVVLVILLFVSTEAFWWWLVIGAVLLGIFFMATRPAGRQRDRHRR